MSNTSSVGQFVSGVFRSLPISSKTGVAVSSIPATIGKKYFDLKQKLGFRSNVNSNEGKTKEQLLTMSFAKFFETNIQLPKCLNEIIMNSPLKTKTINNELVESKMSKFDLVRFYNKIYKTNPYTHLHDSKPKQYEYQIMATSIQQWVMNHDSTKYQLHNIKTNVQQTIDRIVKNFYDSLIVEYKKFITNESIYRITNSTIRDKENIFAQLESCLETFSKQIGKSKSKLKDNRCNSSTNNVNEKENCNREIAQIIYSCQPNCVDNIMKMFNVREKIQNLVINGVNIVEMFLNDSFFARSNENISLVCNPEESFKICRQMIKKSDWYNKQPNKEYLSQDDLNTKCLYDIFTTNQVSTSNISAQSMKNNVNRNSQYQNFLNSCQRTNDTVSKTFLSLDDHYNYESLPIDVKEQVSQGLYELYQLSKKYCRFYYSNASLSEIYLFDNCDTTKDDAIGDFVLEPASLDFFESLTSTIVVEKIMKRIELAQQKVDMAQKMSQNDKSLYIKVFNLCEKLLKTYAMLRTQMNKMFVELLSNDIDISYLLQDKSTPFLNATVRLINLYLKQSNLTKEDTDMLNSCLKIIQTELANRETNNFEDLVLHLDNSVSDSNNDYIGNIHYSSDNNDNSYSEMDDDFFDNINTRLRNKN